VAMVAVPAACGRPLDVVAADPDPGAGDFYRAAFPRLGHNVQVVRTGPELVEACRMLGPDLVVTATVLPGLDGLKAAELVCAHRRIPVVLVADEYAPQALANDCVLACLSRPLRETALGAAVAVAVGRFNQVQALRAEVAELRQALEDRKAIERAKGAVVRRVGVSEDEAYRRMRKMASNANRKLIDVARQVLTANEVFSVMEAD
jgi:AmiR/NasT family two-component response regulator